MSTTAENRSVKALKRQVTDQNEQISSLKQRVNLMRDDMAVIETDISRFKRQVQSDIKMLVEKLDR